MDKNKILDAAAKLVAKGAYDKAIREYSKVLDVDPKDVRVLHKLGELYEKKNDAVQAATFFTRVADSYAHDGFSMKAIALFKKVLKLDPSLIDINLRLAELHQQHQLMSESMAYYQAVANHHDKNGNVRASLDILKKMVDLDPENVSSRIKLAELYARESMNTEAQQEFRRAAEYLKRNSRIDDYLRVAERLVTLDPNDLPLSRELAAQYLQKGDQKRALARLQVCFKADPRDVETLHLLAQAFQGLGQTSKTISVYKELAKLHAEQGRHDEANRTWAKIGQLDPNDPDLVARSAQRAAPEPAPQPSAHAAQFSQAHAAAPRQAPAQQPQAAGGLTRDQLSKLLTETDVYVKYGLHDKALEHLRRVFAVDPENLDAHEKAYQIYVAANNAAAASEQLLNVLRLCTRREDVQRAQPYLVTILQQNPHHPEVPAFLAVLRSGDMPEVEPLVEEEAVAEDAILVESSDEEIIVADAPEDALAEDAIAYVASLQDEEVVADDELVLDEPLIAQSVDDDPLTIAASSVDDEVIDPVSAEIVVEDPALEAVVEDDFDDEPIVPTATFELPEEPKTGKWDAAPVAAAVAAADEAYAFDEDAAEVTYEVTSVDPTDEQPVLAQPVVEELVVEDPVAEDPIVEEAYAEEEPAGEECDEANFFLDQGLLEEAREILETIQIAFPGHARGTKLMARLEQLEAGGTGEAEAASPEPYATESYSTASYSSDAYASEAYASETYSPESYEAAPPAVEPYVVSDEGRDAFDLAAELADELGDLGAEESAGAPASDDYQVSVEEVFSEFKKGLEKIVKPEDVDTHYDLGIAYKEMGLLDDAIGEFEVARQGCVGKKREIDCLTMIGLLQMMKGDAPNAIDAFKTALSSEHAAPDTAKALRFELATAWESAGSLGKALFHLEAVHAEDPRFRDVAANLQRLAQLAQPEDDPMPPRTAKAKSNGVGAPGLQPTAPRATGSRSGKVGYV